MRLLGNVRIWDDNGDTRLTIDASEVSPLHLLQDCEGRGATLPEALEELLIEVEEYTT